MSVPSKQKVAHTSNELWASNAHTAIPQREDWELMTVSESDRVTHHFRQPLDTLPRDSTGSPTYRDVGCLP